MAETRDPYTSGHQQRVAQIAIGLDEALDEISTKKGTLYDPEVVEACLRLFRERAFRLDQKTLTSDFRR